MGNIDLQNPNRKLRTFSIESNQLELNSEQSSLPDVPPPPHGDSTLSTDSLWELMDPM